MRTSSPSANASSIAASRYGWSRRSMTWPKVLAAELAGENAAGYVPAATSTRLKVTGIDLFSAGDFSGDDVDNEVVFRDAARGVYKRVVLRDDKLVGAVLYGDAADGGWYFDLMATGDDVSAMRDTLIFGQAYHGGSSLDPTAAVAALPDDAEICGCNGVSKGAIVAAIHAGLTTLEEVRAKTKASASCGQCTGTGRAAARGDAGRRLQGRRRAKPVCKCTDLAHEEVRGASSRSS